MCVYICVCICVCVYIYIYIHTIYTYICYNMMLSLSLYVCIYIYMYMYIHSIILHYGEICFLLDIPVRYELCFSCLTSPYVLNISQATWRRPSTTRAPEELRGASRTASLRTEILDFRGFDSSSILRSGGGVLVSKGNFQESLSQRIFAGRFLVRLGVSRRVRMRRPRTSM